MQTIWVTRGIPASGKSTWAQNKVLEDKGKTVRISRDSLRTMFNVNPWSEESFGNEDITLVMRDTAIFKALAYGKDVIIDETNMGGKVYKQIVKMVQDRRMVGITVREKPFYVELEVALERDKNRTPAVGEATVRKFWDKSGGKQFAKVVERETVFANDGKAKVREPIRYIEGAPTAIICDLDGTLALFGDRNPYDRDFENDWPNLPVLKTIEQFCVPKTVLLPLSGLPCTMGPQYSLIFCSGREWRHRPATVEFLNRVLGGRIPYELYMRTDGDYRKDAIVKEELFDAHIRNKYNVLFVLDDRNQVVQMWRELGLTVFQVADGDF